MVTEIRNALIENIRLVIEKERLNVIITFDYGYNLHQQVAIVMYTPGPNVMQDMNVCGYFLYRLMTVVGVSCSEHLEGKYVRVRTSDVSIDRIGHITEDRWIATAGLAHEMMGEETPRAIGY